MNLYGFVNNNSIDYVDHLGHITIGFYGARVWGVKKHYGNKAIDKLGASIGVDKIFNSKSHSKALKYLLKKLDLNEDGVYNQCDVALKEDKQKEDIKLFGHSWGGYSAILLSNKIFLDDRFEKNDKFNGKEIKLLATIDPVDKLRQDKHLAVVPESVQSFWNRYQHRGDPYKGKSFTSSAKSSSQINLSPDGITKTKRTYNVGVDEKGNKIYDSIFIDHINIIWEVESEFKQLFNK